MPSYLKRFKKTSPVLPYEIWLHIASFIPNDLSRLLHVHRAFFDLAMDLAYRDVLIYHEREESTRRCLKAMGPIAASHARKLVLRPHLFGLYMPSKAGAPFDQISNWRNDTSIKDAPMRLDRSDGGSKASNIRILMHRVREMTQLTSLVVGCYSIDSWPDFINSMPFLDAAWSHSPRLQNLALHLPVECLGNVLASIPHFPVLEELELSIWSDPEKPADPLVYTTTPTMVTTFINRHSASLTRLTIDIRNLDPSSLFMNIQQLPKLIKLSTEQSLGHLDSSEGGHITNFLSEHRTNLQELKLQFYEPPICTKPTPTSFFSSSVFQVEFPSVTSLNLGICYWDKKSESSLSRSLAQYLFHFRDTLSKLTIRGCILSLPIIEAFASAFGEDSVLRELKMDVHYLSSDLLDVLAHKLPQLRSLDLTYSWLQYKDDARWDADLANLTGSWQSEEFLTKVRRNDYSLWALRYLQVFPRELHAGQCGDVRKIMAACLPNVQTINGILRDKFKDSYLRPPTPLYSLPEVWK